MGRGQCTSQLLCDKVLGSGCTLQASSHRRGQFSSFARNSAEAALAEEGNFKVPVTTLKLEYKNLTEDEIRDGLATLSGWSVMNGKLTKSFSFDSYLAGPAFASLVAEVAESLDHHPDILIGYRKVTVFVNTHAVNGISPYDFELAKRIEALR